MDPRQYSEEMERSKAQPEEGESPSGGEAEPAKRPLTERVDEAEAKDEDKSSSNGEPELDPRSYQAKSVPQRMAIISAGVIMNLIFAVIFATIAYRFGVSYQSTVVGSLSPGGPAWKAGLRPGDKIIQIGKSGEPNQYLRFRHDLTQDIALNGEGKDLDLLIERASGETEWITVKPEKYPDADFPRIGIAPNFVTQLPSDKDKLVLPGSAAEKAEPPFEPKDKIVAANGEPIGSVQDLRMYLARHPDDEVPVTVERTEASEGEEKISEVDIKVPPSPVKTLGIVMEMGPIVAIQPESPAVGKLEVGDIINKVNGDPFDPMRLPDILRKLAADGATASFEITRDEKSQTIEVTPREPTMAHKGLGHLTAPMLSDELGIAYEVSNLVRVVEPGSPAAEAGIEAGDLIAMLKFLAPTEKEQKTKAKQTVGYEPVDLGKSNRAWPILHAATQRLPEGTRVQLTFNRKVDGVPNQIAKELTPAVAKDWHYPQRGLNLLADSQTRVATGWDEAFQLGLRETWESSTKVVVFLRKLVTMQISPTNLGGPLTIAVVATSEASQGPSRLLIFLTLLSANLAVVNFLPIPILDGGHMMFLLYEGITRRKPSEAWFIRLSLAGLAFILSLMVLVIGLDVFRLANLFS